MENSLERCQVGFEGSAWDKETPRKDDKSILHLLSHVQSLSPPF